MTWILHPLTPYAFLAVGLLFSLVLFASVKKENASLRRTIEQHNESSHAAIEAFRQSLSQLQRNLTELGTEPDFLPPAVSTSAALTRPMNSINLNTRSLVLRMYRRGASPEQIASSLQVPRSEVELLLKVHETVLNQRAGQA